ncbi:MAG: nuclear transport factor 2 family protein [Sneathiellaceae bacterium]
MTAQDATANERDGMDSATARWLEMFFRFFAAPSPERYRPLFHPEGSLQDAGMAEPLPAAQTGAAIAMVLAKLPDLLIRPLRHAARGSHVFVEARNSGTLNGKALDWGAVYRVHLKDGLVHRGRRFYDQVELFGPILPAGAALPAFPAAEDAAPPEAALPVGDGAEALARRLEAAWNDADPSALAALYAPAGSHMAPGLAAPVARRQLAAWRRWWADLLAPGPMRPVDWAMAAGTGTNPTLLFLEWQGQGRYLGSDVPLDRIDRYLLDGAGRILESRSYFDTLGLVERANPDVAAIRAAVIKG